MKEVTEEDLRKIEEEPKVYFNTDIDYKLVKYIFDVRTMYLTMKMNKENIVVIDKDFIIAMANKLKNKYAIRTIQNFIYTLRSKGVLMKIANNGYMINKNYYLFYDGSMDE